MLCFKVRGKITFTLGRKFYQVVNYTNTHKKGVVAFIYEDWSNNKRDFAFLFDMRLKKVIAKVRVRIW